MQKVNTLFYKLVPQHNVKQAYFLLVSCESTITHRTAMQYVTLCAITERMLNNALSALQAQYSTEHMCNVTSDSVAKTLHKLFEQQNS